jgi:tetratricopeptide (TPR) repeat protein
MEGTKNRLISLIVLLLLPVFWANAQKKDLTYYQCAFYESYRGGSMAPWPRLIEEMEQEKTVDLAWQIEIVKAMYGLVGYQIGLHDKDAAKIYIGKADTYFEKLLTKYPANAQLHSLAGAFYGYKIALAVYKAPFLGPKSMEHIDKSIKLDPDEPMGYIEKGNSLQYRPAIFGGDKMEGLKCYRKALALFEAHHEPACNWQQMLLRAFILKSLYETNQKAEAETFLSAMQKDYGSMNWIKAFVGIEFMENK